MKRILVISSSPRPDGNSDLLCREFARGARKAGGDVEEIALRDLEIAPCRACYACFQSGSCIQSDGMGGLLEAIRAADVLAVATPTYFATMCGQLKVMVDRLLPAWQNLGGKDVYLIVTGHDAKPGLELAGKELATVFGNLGDAVRGVVWGERVWRKGEALGTPALETAHRMGIEAAS